VWFLHVAAYYYILANDIPVECCNDYNKLKIALSLWLFRASRTQTQLFFNTTLLVCLNLKHSEFIQPTWLILTK